MIGRAGWCVGIWQVTKLRRKWEKILLRKRQKTDTGYTCHSVVLLVIMFFSVSYALSLLLIFDFFYCVQYKYKYFILLLYCLH